MMGHIESSAIRELNEKDEVIEPSLPCLIMAQMLSELRGKM